MKTRRSSAFASSPHVITGRLSPDDERAVFQWISLNSAGLIAYWEGQIDTMQLGQMLKPIAARRSVSPAP